MDSTMHDKQELEKESIQSQQEVSSPAEPNWHEQYLHVSADFANYKRRMQLEQASWMRMAKIDVLKKIVPLLDDLDAAIKTGESSEVATRDPQWFAGCVLIAKNLHKALADLGVERIIASGTFNPDLHEALLQVASEQHASGEIVQELSPGYKIGDMVIRHAKVSVAQ